jgi:methionyl-tRNA formyltransferase
MPGSLLVLTMPGFGIETLRHLVADAAWPAGRVSVGLVGQRPSVWRRLAARGRWLAYRRADRLHHLANGTLAAGPAEAFLRSQALPLRWLANDAEVRDWRASLRPTLTLTLTSRILFSQQTLAEGDGAWLNLHPGLLPEYAGAAPGPYMYADSVGGCTIHVMAARIDAGAIVDLAPMSGDLGADGGDYFFARLPKHAAGRLAWLLRQWTDGFHWPATGATSGMALRHCSSSRLAADRQLDWRWPAGRLSRWVRALAAIAPAWVDDGRGRRIEVMAAEPRAAIAGEAAGMLIGCQGRWIEVACAEGVVALRCRSTPRLQVGQRLPLRDAGAPA